MDSSRRTHTYDTPLLQVQEDMYCVSNLEEPQADHDSVNTRMFSFSCQLFFYLHQPSPPLALTVLTASSFRLFFNKYSTFLRIIREH